MRDSISINVVPYEEKYAISAIEMWRKSKEKALGIAEVHSFENHLHFLKAILPKSLSKISLTTANPLSLARFFPDFRCVEQLCASNQKKI